MNDAQISLVKDSWAQVAPIAPTAAALFYDRLFTQAPGVLPMFADDLTEQKRKLMDMLGAVVGRLEDLDAAASEVDALGGRHAGYGARPDHYDVVGECLLWTLGQGLGEDFTPEVKDAWATLYGTLATRMVRAQASPPREPSHTPG
jgi:hemoglobin-like flavoprotein